MATSVATWSLRDRAVCSLPPTGPTISVSRRSIAMWMSSSPSANGNEPVLELGPHLLQAALQLVASSASVMIPCAASIAAWATDWSTS